MTDLQFRAANSTFTITLKCPSHVFLIEVAVGCTGTRVLLPGIEPDKPRPGHHRSHPQRKRTRHSHPLQAPQRLPGRLDRTAETVWDGVRKEMPIDTIE